MSSKQAKRRGQVRGNERPLIDLGRALEQAIAKLDDDDSDEAAGNTHQAAVGCPQYIILSPSL